MFTKVYHVYGINSNVYQRVYRGVSRWVAWPPFAARFVSGRALAPPPPATSFHLPLPLQRAFHCAIRAQTMKDLKEFRPREPLKTRTWSYSSPWILWFDPIVGVGPCHIRPPVPAKGFPNPMCFKSYPSLTAVPQNLPLRTKTKSAKSELLCLWGGRWSLLLHPPTCPSAPAKGLPHWF